MFANLFNPITVKGVTFKNRLAVPAMVANYCTKDGEATERFIKYHETKAKGGWGLIITEDYAMDPMGKGFSNIPGLWCDKQIQSHTELPKRIHKYGAKIFAQIYHCGRQTNHNVIGDRPFAPTAIPCPFSPDMPIEMSLEKIEETIEQFGDCALRAKKCGFDGVEIHGAHGYLIAQFMSSYSNKRSDEYGGNLINRLRFPINIIKNMRKKCGADFLICFRISADECVEGGRRIEDTKAMVPYLEEAGIDIIHVSAGCYRSFDCVIPSYYTDHAWIAKLAREVKPLTNLPVITIGRYNDPSIADTVIRNGDADFVAMGRQSLCDPEFPNKAKEGRLEDIIHCLACHQGCVTNLFADLPIKCIFNPLLGQEYCTEIKETQEPKKVAIIGAGPSGMEAAIVAAKRGHKVTIYEKNNVAGGQFHLAAVPPCKGEIAAFTGWQLTQLKKLGVEIKYNTEVTVDFMKENTADVIIVATGANPIVPKIKGIESKSVVTANDVLSGKVNVGKKIVVIGGGEVGCETADHLATQLCNVTLVEMLDDVARELFIVPKWGLLESLEKNKVRVLKNTTVSEITDDSVHVTGSVDEDIPVTDVVLAIGSTSNNKLANDLIAAGLNVKVIGDADKVAQGGEAIAAGFKVGNEI